MKTTDYRVSIATDPAARHHLGQSRSSAAATPDFTDADLDTLNEQYQRSISPAKKTRKRGRAASAG
jgi:hypothetical protein